MLNPSARWTYKIHRLGTHFWMVAMKECTHQQGANNMTQNDAQKWTFQKKNVEKLWDDLLKIDKQSLTCWFSAKHSVFVAHEKWSSFDSAWYSFCFVYCFQPHLIDRFRSSHWSEYAICNRIDNAHSTKHWTRWRCNQITNTHSGNNLKEWF